MPRRTQKAAPKPQPLPQTFGVETAQEGLPSYLPAPSEVVEISVLILDPNNARGHDEDNIDDIKLSLLRFGQQKHVVVGRDNVVIAGNGTVTAARALGWTHISIVRSNLTGVEALLYAIADNKTAETSAWNWQQLGINLAEARAAGDDLTVTAFTQGEIDNILSAEWKPPETQDLPAGLPKQHDASQAKPISVTPAQRETIDQAVQRLREFFQEDITEGRCLELICANFMTQELREFEDGDDE